MTLVEQLRELVARGEHAGRSVTPSVLTVRDITEGLRAAADRLDVLEADLAAVRAEGVREGLQHAAAIADRMYAHEVRDSILFEVATGWTVLPQEKL